MINDFALFCDVIHSTAKVLEAAQITINENGLVIYGARARLARCEITSNAVYSQEPVTFCILELKLLDRVLTSAKDIHGNDFTDFKIFVDMPFLRFQSKKFKTKMTTCSEDIIGKWISKKIETEMKPVFEFTTTSDLIKRINSHQYIFADSDKLRIYLSTKDDMENNALFATIGNNGSELNNEMTLKFGIVTFGKLEGRELTLDLERVNLFNAIQSQDIKVQLMDKSVLVGKTHVTGKNNSFFNFVIYNTMLKI